MRSFGEIDDLKAAGVYAIYYTGPSEHYAPVAERNAGGAYEWPIYVGKAIPKGGRKGGVGFDAERARALRDRLGKHARSISEAQNLELDDFAFRSLVVDDIWIPLGENVLIERFKPVWNLVIDGFGNNDPGAGRMAQKKSSWDVLHSGRRFAIGLTGGVKHPEEVLRGKLQAYYERGWVERSPEESMIREEEDDDGG